MENTNYQSIIGCRWPRARQLASWLLGLGLVATVSEATQAQTITKNRPVRPQTVVPLGAASYASEPPYPSDIQVRDAKGNLVSTYPDTARYDFYYRSPLYISRAAKQNHTPVPTNDWWTDLLINGKNGGVMWVYPLVLDPDPNGFNLNFPNSIDVDNPGADGSGGGLQYALWR